MQELIVVPIMRLPGRSPDPALPGSGGTDCGGVAAMTTQAEACMTQDRRCRN